MPPQKELFFSLHKFCSKVAFESSSNSRARRHILSNAIPSRFVSARACDQIYTASSFCRIRAGRRDFTARFA